MSDRKCIFKNGDRVFHFASGWGKVIECDADIIMSRYYIHWDDDRKGYCSEDYLSFTEYKLVGISQERPEFLPEVGDVVWVKDKGSLKWHIAHFWRKDKDLYCVSSCMDQNDLAWFDEMITENPYKK
jgi:hypothetical protein